MTQSKRSNTAVMNITLTRSRRQYQEFYLSIQRGGQRLKRSFSCRKYGVVNAYRRAVNARSLFLDMVG